MTRDTLLWLAGLLTRLPLNTGADDWRATARQIATAQDEIAAELQAQGVTWTPPGGQTVPAPNGTNPVA